MFNFSNRSLENLGQCHIDLQILFKEVIKHYDCSVLCGHRDKEEQNELYNARPQRSKVQYPNSRHNSNPSIAIDVAPYPYPTNCDKDIKELAKFYLFCGRVEGIAIMLLQLGYIAHEIRWGGDWDSDNDLKDQTFDDLAHFELRSIK